jgi:hypothetical protein
MRFLLVRALICKRGPHLIARCRFDASEGIRYLPWSFARFYRIDRLAREELNGCLMFGFDRRNGVRCRLLVTLDEKERACAASRIAEVQLGR